MVSTDFINTLPNETLLHCFKFLPGKDLIRCTEVSPRFRDIVTSNKATMKKIKLTVSFDTVTNNSNFNNGTDLHKLLELVKKRPFINAEFQHISDLRTAVGKVKLLQIFAALASTVENLIVRCQIPHETFVIMLDHFLPKVKSITLDSIVFVNFERISLWAPLQNLSLQSLALLTTQADDVLYFFSGCSRPKKFKYKEPEQGTSTKADQHLNAFLAPLSDLVQISHIAFGLDVNRLTCFNLKRLRTYVETSEQDEDDIADFIRKQRDLTFLDIAVSRVPTRHLMEAIAKSPRLRQLTMRCRDDPWDQTTVESMDGLHNNSVRQLFVTDEASSTHTMLQIFKEATKILLFIVGSELVLHDVSQSALRKITFCDDHLEEPLHVILGPLEMPTNMEDFERSTMEFLMRNGNFINAVTIGNGHWRHNGNNKVSNLFCIKLISDVDIAELNVYNIEERVDFLRHVSSNSNCRVKRIIAVEPLVTANGEPTNSPHFETY